MRRQYRLRSDKARLCTRVAAEERALLADHTGRDISPVCRDSVLSVALLLLLVY